MRSASAFIRPHDARQPRVADAVGGCASSPTSAGLEHARVRDRLPPPTVSSSATIGSRGAGSVRRNRLRPGSLAGA